MSSTSEARTLVVRKPRNCPSTRTGATRAKPTPPERSRKVGVRRTMELTCGAIVSLTVTVIVRVAEAVPSPLDPAVAAQEQVQVLTGALAAVTVTIGVWTEPFLALSFQAADGLLDPEASLLFPTYHDPAPFQDLRYELEERHQLRACRCRLCTPSTSATSPAG